MSDFFASVGERLFRFELDSLGTLHHREELGLESPIHYVWPHSDRRLLYVASSKRWFTPHDGGHMLSVVKAPVNGGLRQVGKSVTLPTRPIHITVDQTNRFIVCVFNVPPGIEVRALLPDGSIGEKIEQPQTPDVGVFPHQARFSPNGSWLLIPARGNHPGKDSPEEPGSLRRFAFEEGRLRLVQVVAPNGGYGFGPRHIDFHPTLPFIYVSVERQNQLQVFRFDGAEIEESRRQTFSTLSPEKSPLFPQHAGAIHVNAAANFVYVINRDDLTNGTTPTHITGDNTIAAFAIDPANGSVSPPVHSDLDAFHVRTFSLSAPYIVAASQADVFLPGESGPRKVGASLSVFRMRADGYLNRVHRTDMQADRSMLFWCGFPHAYGASWG
ncbi:lactonase family protein [Caballeronia calidae]|nr:beta-propeller fold lactonase family protein [Caballeronia calidae]